MKTIIMAGGKGTRISSIANDIPKPMIVIGDRPVLEHEIACLRRQGLTDIVITVGHLGHIIMNYFGDGSAISPVTGESFGVHIKYFIEEMPLGNAGALLQMKEELDEDFLLLNADAMLDVDFSRLIAYHFEKKATATLFVHPNNHPYDSGLIITDENNKVTQWLHKEDPRPNYYQNCVNAGIHVLSPKAIEKCVSKGKVDLDRDILKPLVPSGTVYAYRSPEYVRDMGTPERYNTVQNDFGAGTITGKNLINPQKAIFLDRDGTLNEYVGFLRRKEDFVLVEDAGEAVRKINQAGYLAIVVTNQPVIARGEITIEELREIHNKMETLLGEQGAYLDAIYFCPHHPDKGYEGEITELKVECECRKPKPGMLLYAARDYNIDLEQSWMIGDSERDVMAGEAAGCRTILIGKDKKQYCCADNLMEAINHILKEA